MIRKALWKSLFLATVSAAFMMAPAATYAKETSDATIIELSDEVIKVNGENISEDSASAVYAGAQIVYYEEGKDELYGEGDADDAHSAE